MDMTACQQRLAILWFGVSGLIFALVLARLGLGGIPPAGSKLVWTWLLPNIVPTLSLMIAVLVAEALAPPPTPKQANLFLFRLAFGLSLAYLLVLLLFLLIPGVQIGGVLSNDQQIWMTPLQGLVTAALGAFFVKTSH